MIDLSQPSRARRAVLALFPLVMLAALAGCGQADDRPDAPALPAPTSTAPAPAQEPAGAAPAQAYELLPPSEPVRVEIPGIGVTSDLIPLGLQDDGAMEVPEDFDLAGWFTEGPQPGQVGPSIIAGHVDSTAGPAIFYRLADLQAGDEVLVTRADGRVLTFVVETRDQYPKSDLPTEAVFGPITWPGLRLITCGGDFDQGERSYRDNIVVSARLKTA